MIRLLFAAAVCLTLCCQGPAGPAGQNGNNGTDGRDALSSGWEINGNWTQGGKIMTIIDGWCGVRFDASDTTCGTYMMYYCDESNTGFIIYNTSHNVKTLATYRPKDTLKVLDTLWLRQ